MRRGSRIALMSLLGACGRDRPPPPRPSQPTLTVMPAAAASNAAPAAAAAAAAPAAPAAPAAGDTSAAGHGRRVVAAGQIAQPWHVGAWAPASITLPQVAAGDAIVVLGAYWGDLEAGSSTEPSDDHGALVRVIDQGPQIVGRTKPPVFAQLFVELDAAAGSHTIIPPYLGGPAGDGTFYVLQIRGLVERSVVTSGQARTTAPGVGSGSSAPGLTGITVETVAAAPGDLVIALAGYDNTAPRATAGWSPPPAGWLALGVQDDPTDNVPSELRYRTATAPGPQAVTWSWGDPTVNVAAAVIAVLR